MLEVKNKVCIITGSGAGLGKAYAAKLLQFGTKVCISDINEKAGAETLQEFQEKFGKDKACFVRCDVTKEEQFVNLFDETEKFFGVKCVDILVNNAGINNNLGWRKCFDVNIMGVMIGMEIALERMQKTSTKGEIINCASLAGFVTGSRAIGEAYYGSKHACVTVSRNVATDFANTKIPVKCLCPGFANTAIINVQEEHQTQFNKEINEFGLLEPDEVADAFYKLLTECGNGATMGIMKGFPMIIIPDYGRPGALLILFLSVVVSKVTGLKMVTPVHHILCAFILIAIMLLLFCWFV